MVDTHARISKLTPHAEAAVRAEFDRQISAGLHPAAALSVYVGGEQVLDLTGGMADAATAKPAASNTLFRIFSCGKPLAASCLWVLHERGKVRWDDPVAKYWPEFAAKGKGGVTVKHVLTHQAGIPTTPVELADWRDFADWGRCVTALENAELEFAPGSRVQYHPANFGWLVAELASRISGQPFNDFFVKNVAGPLGLKDTYFSLPQSLNGTVAKLRAMPGFENAPIADSFNSLRAYSVVMPGGGCTSTARDLARFYAVLNTGGMAGAVQWLKPETVADVIALYAESVDMESGRYQRRTLGMALGGEAPNTYGSAWKSRTFGHGGLGTSVTWGDPDTGVSAAYLTTGIQPDAINRDRLFAMCSKVRSALTK